MKVNKDTMNKKFILTLNKDA